MRSHTTPVLTGIEILDQKHANIFYLVTRECFWIQRVGIPWCNVCMSSHWKEVTKISKLADLNFYHFIKVYLYKRPSTYTHTMTYHHNDTIMQHTCNSIHVVVDKDIWHSNFLIRNNCNINILVKNNVSKIQNDVSDHNLNFKQPELNRMIINQEQTFHNTKCIVMVP